MIILSLFVSVINYAMFKLYRLEIYILSKKKVEQKILFCLRRKNWLGNRKFYFIEDFIGKSTSTLNSSISFLSYICGSVGNLETSKQMHNLGVE